MDPFPSLFVCLFTPSLYEIGGVWGCGGRGVTARGRRLFDISFFFQECLNEVVSWLHDLSSLPLCSEQLDRLLHENGLNCRVLPKLAEKVILPHVRQLVETDLVARTCKDMLNKHLRKLVEQHKK